MGRIYILTLRCLLLGLCLQQTAGLDVRAADGFNPDGVNSGRADTVILIGLDGLRAKAIDEMAAPHLQQLARNGVRSVGMIPVMPSKTFVNFYSMATGLYPQHHGMVSNSPYDRRLARQFSTREDVSNPDWWLGEPIWITAEKQGLKTATYFWVGSEVEIDGHRPSYWKPYQQSKDYAERIEEVLAWMDLPESQRPHLITLYFSAVDSAVHKYGVGSSQEKDAVMRVDKHIGDLLSGLQQRGKLLSSDVIVVSDHGMADLSDQRLINLDNWLDLQGWIVPEWHQGDDTVSSPYLYLFNSDDKVDQAYQLLKHADPHLQVLKPAEYPLHFHFNHPQRGPDLLLLADPGWAIFASRGAGFKQRSPGHQVSGATHGWDNHSESMQATFIAQGPDFKQGERLAAFENIEVYGLLACLLGIEPAENDGEIAHVAAMLRQPCH